MGQVQVLYKSGTGRPGAPDSAFPEWPSADSAVAAAMHGGCFPGWLARSVFSRVAFVFSRTHEDTFKEKARPYIREFAVNSREDKGALVYSDLWSWP